MARQTARQQILELLPHADADQLRLVVAEILDITLEAQGPIDWSDYGIGGSREENVVSAEHSARVNLGDDIDRAVLSALPPHQAGESRAKAFQILIGSGCCSNDVETTLTGAEEALLRKIMAVFDASARSSCAPEIELYELHP